VNDYLVTQQDPQAHHGARSKRGGRANWLIHSVVAVNPPNELKCSFISP